MSKKFQKISEEVIDKNPHWTYKKDIFECDGKKEEYFYGEFADGVIVIPVLDNGQIVLIRQYRYLRDRYSIEFTMGGLQADETPAQAAVRELKEETGLESSNFSKIAEFEPYIGSAKDTSHVFLANEISGDGILQLDEAEDIEVIYRRPDEIDRMIHSGEIWHGQTIAAWMLARDLVMRPKHQ
ncbi:MAG: NUDIX hydrolase [Candidatus Magasanikbacteria bacterium]|nr:NUDIX hydrolase [Candidatus Magasanikbacteria bacterium]